MGLAAAAGDQPFLPQPPPPPPPLLLLLLLLLLPPPPPPLLLLLLLPSPLRSRCPQTARATPWPPTNITSKRFKLRT